MIRPVFWEDDRVRLLDQRRLPAEERWLTLSRWEEVAEAIRCLSIRGAPAIGIAAAYGIVLASETSCEVAHIEKAAQVLRDARPTAVNLAWALDRIMTVFRSHAGEPQEAIRAALLVEARRIHEEDVQANRRIGEMGAALLPEGSRVLTICNTGALATGGYGTALGVIRTAHEQGRLELVYVCETRPVLQGARLTAWELLQQGIPFRILVDGAAGWLLSHGKAEAVLVGADRIARNGDVANKIGTYSLACLASHHGVPFYVVAPTSTVDVNAVSGQHIPIEERDENEVLRVLGARMAPEGARAWNPAFDVTPAELITAIVTERGVIRAPYHETIPQAVA